MQHTKSLILVATINFASTAHAMEKARVFIDGATHKAKTSIQHYVQKPSVINPDLLNQEQKTEVQQVYKDFCTHRVEETKKKALRHGLPAGFLASFPLAGVAKMLLNPSKSLLEGVLIEGPAIIIGSGVGVPLALYSAYHVGSAAINYYKLKNFNSLKYLNGDLYNELGKPTVHSHDQKTWGLETPHICMIADFANNQEDVQRAFDGNYKCTEIHVPENHAK
jgi:hypothetical protein